jgi:hypothetical protein
MYRCELCGTVVPPRTACHRVVVAARARRYSARPQVNRVVRFEGTRRKVIWTDDPGGEGPAIVREALACPGCAANHARPAPVSPSR